MSIISLVWRKSLAAFFIACLSFSSGLFAQSQSHSVTPRPPAPRRPNIILILADDLGYGDLGCYGQTKIRTPNIDKLAKEGIRFTDFYAGSTICAPSRCCLMTGLDTGHAAIRGNEHLPLPSNALTVAELLRRSGYATGLLGKWGLGDAGSSGVPQRQGFEEFAGYLSQTRAHDYYPPYLDCFVPGYSYDKNILAGNQNGAKGQYAPDLLTKAALNFIRIHKPDQFNRHKPFFLYLAYTIPHANNEEGRRAGNGMEVPSDEPYSSQPWPQPEKNKAAMITRLDGYVGQILDKLKESGQDENTLVFFTSDNGPHKEGGVDPKFFQSSGPLRGIKRDLYEGGIRVPLIVRWKDQIEAGKVTDEVGAFWDFLPTAADIAWLKPPKDIDGISLLPTLLNHSQTNHHEFLYWEFHERGPEQAVRMGDWKAVRLKPGEPLELYNLKNDLAEKHDAAKENPRIVAKVEEYLKTARTDSERWPLKAAPNPGKPPVQEARKK